jgi:hypothetical protein
MVDALSGARSRLAACATRARRRVRSAHARIATMVPRRECATLGAQRDAGVTGEGGVVCEAG